MSKANLDKDFAHLEVQSFFIHEMVRLEEFLARWRGLTLSPERVASST